MHKNQLDKIRILAALVVIFSHHYPLTAHQAPAWLENKWLHWSVTGGVGVMVFFCISGYLVTMSWYREPKIVPFLWKRVLRLWPGMLASVLLGIFFFGIIFNVMPAREYLATPTTWKFFWTNLTLLKQFPFLPGTFTTNPSSQVMNGVYWTIPMEFTCYLILASLGLLGVLKRTKLLKTLILIYFAIFLIYFNPDFTGRIHHWVEYPAFFAAGAFIALHKDWFSKHSGKLLIIATPVLLSTYFLTPYIATSRFLLLPPLVIFLGSLPAQENWFSKLGDPSYGIYLYGYPIAQSVMALWPDMNFWGSLALTFALSICAGYASWLFIESRALRWKNAFSKIAEAPPEQHSKRNPFSHIPWAWAWPLMATVAGLWFIALHIHAPVPVDAEKIYLPMARALIQLDWAVLLEPDSYYAAPLAYLWPAIWLADPVWIRVANMGLWIGCVWFLWSASTLLGGIRVGAIALLLLVLSPEILRYFPSELTEPLYLFGLFGWMHAMARMIVNQERSMSVIAYGAIMLTITLLSRPVLQLIAPALLLTSLGAITYRTMFRKSSPHPHWMNPLPTIAQSIIIGLLLPLAIVIKNGILFDLWGISSGSGIGLYLGTHPLFQGAEPYFLGFDYDINHLTGLIGIEDNLRSIAGDTAARQAAIWQIHSMSLPEALAFFSHKLWWWLAQHPAEIDEIGGIIRKLRLFELGTIFTACLWLTWQWLRQSGPSQYIRHTIKPGQWAMAIFLSVMFFCMLGQLLPILYNSRYSSVLLEPWLIPLTAFALTMILQPISLSGTFKKSQWSIGLTGQETTHLWVPVAAIAVILLITFGGYHELRKREHVGIDSNSMGLTEARVNITDVDRIEVQGLERKSDHEWIMSTSPAALLVRIEADDVAQAVAVGAFNALWDTEIALNANGQRCKVETAYQFASGAIAQPDYRLPLTISLSANGSVRHIVTHANNQLRPNEPGYLRLVIHCPTASTVEWRGTKLLESKHAWQASQHHRQ